MTAYGDDKTGDRVHKALSVLDYAEIQEILPNNKTLLRLMNYGNGGHAYVPGMGAELYDKDGIANISLNIDPEQLLDLGDESAANIVSIRGAKIIDLTGNGVTSASNLKELWEDVSEAQLDAGYRRMIKVSLVFNDKYNDDDFRDVYALIITSAKEKDIYDYVAARPAEEEDESITAVLDLTELGTKVIAKKTGATITGDIYSDGTVKITDVENKVETYAARATIIGTITVKISGAGVILDVDIDITDEEADVTKVVIKTGTVVNAEAPVKDGAVVTEELDVKEDAPVATKAVAIAVVGADGKITGISYDTADLEDGLEIVDENGNPIGALAVTTGEGDAPVVKVEIAEEAGVEIAEEGATITATDEDGNETSNDLDSDGNVGDEVEPEPDVYTISVAENADIVAVDPVTFTVGEDEEPVVIEIKAATGKAIIDVTADTADVEITDPEEDIDPEVGVKSVTVSVTNITDDVELTVATIENAELPEEPDVYTISVAENADIVAVDPVTFTVGEDEEPVEITIKAAEGKAIIGVTADTADVEITDPEEDIDPEVGVKSVTVSVTNITEDVELTVATIENAELPEEPEEYTISVTGDGIVEVEDVTLTEGDFDEPVNVEIEAEDGKVITKIEVEGDADVEIDPAELEEGVAAADMPVDGRITAATVSLSNIAGNVTITVTTNDVVLEEYTLTLGVGFPSATVKVDGTTAEPVTTTTADGDKRVYEGITEGAVVAIDITTGEVEEFTYEINGVEIQQNSTNKRVFIAAMTADVELAELKTTMNQAYTITFEEGITPKTWFVFKSDDNYASLHKLTDEQAASFVTNNGDGTYSVKNVGLIGAVEVETSLTNVIAATSKADIIAAEACRPMASTTLDEVTGKIINFEGNLKKDWVVYKTTKVTFDTENGTADGIKVCGYVVDHDGDNAYTVWYVLPGNKLTVEMPESGIAGLLKGEDIVGDNVAASGEINVAETDLSFFGAYTVEYEGANMFAKANGAAAKTDTAVASGKFVKSGAYIKAFTGDDNSVEANMIDVSEGATWDTTAYAWGQIAGNISLKAAVEVEIAENTAATLKITAHDAVLNMDDVDVIKGSGSSAVKAYFLTGTEFTVKSTTEGKEVSVVEAEGGSVAASITARGSNARVTVGDAKLTVSEATPASDDDNA